METEPRRLAASRGRRRHRPERGPGRGAECPAGGLVHHRVDRLAHPGRDRHPGAGRPPGRPERRPRRHRHGHHRGHQRGRRSRAGPRHRHRPAAWRPGDQCPGDAAADEHAHQLGRRDAAGAHLPGPDLHDSPRSGAHPGRGNRRRHLLGHPRRRARRPGLGRPGPPRRAAARGLGGAGHRPGRPAASHDRPFLDCPVTARRAAARPVRGRGLRLRPARQRRASRKPGPVRHLGRSRPARSAGHRGPGQPRRS